MAKYRDTFPEIGTGRIFLSDGGIMTEFFFSDETKNMVVPNNNIFFPLMEDSTFMNWMDKFYKKYMDLCLKENKEFGFILISFLTYKARKEDIKTQFDIDEQRWIQMNKVHIQYLVNLRTEYETSIPNCPPILVSGLIIPKGGHGDAFSLDTKMSIKESEEYHTSQIKVFTEDTKVDFVMVALVTYSEEAIGILNMAAGFKLPVVISYTTEVDGRLPSGETVKVCKIGLALVHEKYYIGLQPKHLIKRYYIFI